MKLILKLCYYTQAFCSLQITTFVTCVKSGISQRERVWRSLFFQKRKNSEGRTYKRNEMLQAKAAKEEM
jgi:hypothetical protein